MDTFGPGADLFPIPKIKRRDESGKQARKHERGAAPVEPAGKEGFVHRLDQRADLIQISQAILPAGFVVSQVPDVDAEQRRRYVAQRLLVGFDEFDRLGQPVAVLDGAADQHGLVAVGLRFFFERLDVHGKAAGAERFADFGGYVYGRTGCAGVGDQNTVIRSFLSIRKG